MNEMKSFKANEKRAVRKPIPNSAFLSFVLSIKTQRNRKRSDS